ncbi:MAG: septum formation protein Maf [Alicyclobacillus sp. RIFOXYA1_FULL_53_8]|nr:MAG: septum formation protein Maf [Alicyclobacillus sp. RIFOXYA1_FULL_53_8]
MTHSHTPAPPLVLASGSLRRQQLLRGLGLDFQIIVSGASEEIAEPVSPARFVELLAERKAREVLENLAQDLSDETVVLGADTIVVLDGKILGKPVDADDAIAMLSELQGAEHLVYTGVCVAGTGEQQVHTQHAVTKVRMRNLSKVQIERYVATGEPMDKAGAYGIQGYGATLVESIEGDYFTVVGLPLALVTDMLEEFGISIWG